MIRALLFLLHATVTTMKMAGAIFYALLHLNVYGAIMARLLFDATELKRFWRSTMQSYQKLIPKTLSILLPFAITHLCESGVSSLHHLKNNYRNHLNPWNVWLLACVWLLVIVCQGMSGYCERSRNKTVTRFVSNEQLRYES